MLSPCFVLRKLEDAKGVIRSRKLKKDRRYNGQKNFMLHGCDLLRNQ